MRVGLSVITFVTLLLVGGCDKISPINRQPSVSGLGGATSDGGAGGGGASQGGPNGSGGAAGNGLPCEVQTVLVKYCSSCHGTPPTGGAPRSLVTYADLTRQDLANSSITEARAALDRMQNKSSPSRQ